MAKYVKTGGHGGLRHGAGRPLNSMPQRKALSLRQRYPTFPLDHMMGVLNAPPPDINPPKKPTGKHQTKDAMIQYRRDLQDYRAQMELHAVAKMDAAKAAAPYIHPRLAAFDINTTQRPSKHELDLTKLTTEELTILERIVAKSQTVTIIDNDDLPDALAVNGDECIFK